MNVYCVYVYLRKDGTPYYVGMGKPDRPYNVHKRGTIDLRPSDRARIVIVASDLSREEALRREIEEIAKYGLKEHGGLLRNLTTGGECPMMSSETRAKMSRSAKGKPKSKDAIMKAVQTRRQTDGYHCSEETRQRMSKVKLGVQVGSKNPAARALLAYDREGRFVGKFDTARDAAKTLNVAWKHIPAVCKGRRPHTGGFVFTYA